jgi:hypothetical protein
LSVAPAMTTTDPLASMACAAAVGAPLVLVVRRQAARRKLGPDDVRLGMLGRGPVSGRAVRFASGADRVAWSVALAASLLAGVVSRPRPPSAPALDGGAAAGMTIAALLLALPAAYICARGTFPGRAAVWTSAFASMVGVALQPTSTPVLLALPMAFGLVWVAVRRMPSWAFDVARLEGASEWRTCLTLVPRWAAWDLTTAACVIGSLILLTRTSTVPDVRVMAPVLLLLSWMVPRLTSAWLEAVQRRP